MGKASSAKKVARAARASGKNARGDRPKLAFPLGIFAIVLFGTLLVVYARTSRDPAAAEGPPRANQDHWHAAYGVWLCDKFAPPLRESPTDPDGIHTHGDGVMHVHPFNSSVSGTNARLAKFTDITWFDDGFKLPDGKEYRNGGECGAGAKVAVYRYPLKRDPATGQVAVDPSRPIQVYEDNFANIGFENDVDAFVIAWRDPNDGKDPPPLPDTISELNQLEDVDEAGAAGGAPGGLVPGAGGAPGGLTPGAAGGAPGAATPGAATPEAPTGQTP